LPPPKWCPADFLNQRQHRQVQRDIGGQQAADRDRRASAALGGDACPPIDVLTVHPADRHDQLLAQAARGIRTAARAGSGCTIAFSSSRLL